jgi:hypothetical protein
LDGELAFVEQLVGGGGRGGPPSRAASRR